MKRLTDIPPGCSNGIHEFSHPLISSTVWRNQRAFEYTEISIEERDEIYLEGAHKFEKLEDVVEFLTPQEITAVIRMSFVRGREEGAKRKTNEFRKALDMEEL